MIYGPIGLPQLSRILCIHITSCASFVVYATLRLFVVGSWKMVDTDEEPTMAGAFRKLSWTLRKPDVSAKKRNPVGYERTRL